MCISNLVIFFVVGVWHGAAWKFIAYGLYNGLIIAFSNLVAPLYQKAGKALHIPQKAKPWMVFQILRTFVLVNIGWYFDMGDQFYGSAYHDETDCDGIFFLTLTDGVCWQFGLSMADYAVLIMGKYGYFCGQPFKRTQNFREAEKSLPKNH